jgi:hypothetical protein
MRRKSVEPRYQLTTQLSPEAHARRHRLQDATGWSASKLITEALQVLEPQIISKGTDSEVAA